MQPEADARARLRIQRWALVLLYAAPVVAGATASPWRVVPVIAVAFAASGLIRPPRMLTLPTRIAIMSAAGLALASVCFGLGRGIAASGWIATATAPVWMPLLVAFGAAFILRPTRQQRQTEQLLDQAFLAITRAGPLPEVQRPTDPLLAILEDFSDDIIGKYVNSDTLKETAERLALLGHRATFKELWARWPDHRHWANLTLAWMTRPDTWQDIAVPGQPARAVVRGLQQADDPWVQINAGRLAAAWADGPGFGADLGAVLRALQNARDRIDLGTEDGQWVEATLAETLSVLKEADDRRSDPSA